MTGTVRTGTCSWSDKTMVRDWYPAGVKSAEARLRYYAAHFDTVEVDSSFYGMPSPGNSRLWVERTPDEFVFHIKAFGMMTRHAVKPEQLAPALRDTFSMELDRSGRIIHPSSELRAATFELFLDSLEPLREAGKLGLILMQFPGYFVANAANREYIRRAAALLRPDRVAVEFRHASWVQTEELDVTLELLSSLGLAYVCVDEPRLDGPTVLPPLAAVTSDTAYVRFHGRNSATWNAKVGSAAERFKYDYSEAELREWVEPIRLLQSEAQTTYVMFNNCYGDYAPRNAQQMMSLLDSADAESLG